MRKYVLFVLFNFFVVQCFAAGAGSGSAKQELGQDVAATMPLPEVPPVVAGMIEGDVVPYTDIKVAPMAKVVDNRRVEPKHAEEERVDVGKIKTVNFGKFKIPADYKTIKILGKARVTRQQALRYLLKNASGRVQLNCSAKDIVDYYYDEAEREGVRADLAFCQAILETGSFSFRGTVRPNQNNFCGLGTTGKTVKGAKFDTAQEGVRAHIQHLLAYCRKDGPKAKIIDPRYDLVHRIRMQRGLITNWYGLNGTWAMGAQYCEKIMAHYYAMLMM